MRHHTTSRTRPGWATVLALLAILGLVVTATAWAPASSTEAVAVIVREVSPDTDHAESLVTLLGGTVEQDLSLIGGFGATIPVTALDLLADDPAIASVDIDGSVRLLSWADETPDTRLPGSM